MNLATIIDPHPDDAVALLAPEPVTYGELRSTAARLRAGLRGLGVQPGDRVGIATGNDPRFVQAYLATLGVGAVAVPLNPTSPAAELEAQLRLVGVKVVVAGPGGSEGLRGVDRRSAGVEHIIVGGNGGGGDGGLVFEALLRHEDDAGLVDRADDDLAVLAFTAGTGGGPKAAMLSHGNLSSNLAQVQAHPGRAVHADDVTLGVLPLFHIFGLNVVLGLALRAGASVRLLDHFDAAATLEVIRDDGVTLVAGAPPMYAAWAALAEAGPGAGPAGPQAFATVRLATSGAAPLPPEVSERFTRAYGLPIYEGYGLTEASPTVTSSVVGGEARAGSIGPPLPGVELRLVDEEGEDALEGDAGEIWVRGPNVFKGYWQDPAATAAVLTPDGWLRTGDVAVADGGGYLSIVDRAKDLIIVSGFNVWPAEVEEVLVEMPGVAGVGVVGVPDPGTGEAVKALVVIEPGAEVTAAEVREFCARHLARYKCPREVSFVASLPHGVGGKLLRRALR